LQFFSQLKFVAIQDARSTNSGQKKRGGHQRGGAQAGGPGMGGNPFGNMFGGGAGDHD
jgi:hypothetical protein